MLSENYRRRLHLDASMYVPENLDVESVCYRRRKHLSNYSPPENSLRSFSPHYEADSLVHSSTVVVIDAVL